MLSISARSYWLLRHSKASARVDAAKKDAIFRIYQFGSASFVLGFAIWNLDNIFCDVLTKWKGFVNWPAAFLLEGWSQLFIPCWPVINNILQVTHGGMS